jgi:peroxiredoxin
MRVYFRHILVLVLCALIAGCMPNTENAPRTKFAVMGEFEGMSGDTVFLKLVKDNGYEFIDSAIVDANGRFSLEGGIAGPDFYILHFASDDSKQITLIPDTAQVVEIKGRAADFPDCYEVEGSPESESVCQLVHRMCRTRNVLDSLGRIFRTNIDSPDLADIKGRLDSVYSITCKEQRMFSENFLKSHPDALAQIVCLSQYIAPKMPVFDPSKDFDIYNNVSERLSARFPDHLQTRKLVSYVEKMRLSKGVGTLTQGKVSKGDIAPDIALRSIKGDTVRLSSLKGKYILLDFWASWSDVSKINTENLNKIYWKYRYNNFVVYQVALEEKSDDWKNGLKAQKIPWVSVSDLKLWNSSAAETYGVRALPASFLIGPDFKVLGVNLSAEELDDKLLQLVGKPIKRSLDSIKVTK